MATVKYFIRTSNKSTKASIRLRFRNGRKFDLTTPTQLTVKPEFWNTSKGTFRQRAEFTDIDYYTDKLTKIETHILKEYNNTPNKDNINKEWLKVTMDKYHNPDKYLQKKHTLFSYIQHFIDNAKTRTNIKTGNPVSYKMRREYQVTFNYLKEYAKKYKEPDFIDIDMEFYQQFVSMLRNKGLATNTIGKKVQTLKIFLNSATEQNINHYFKYKSRNFATITEESDNIYLTKEELNKMYNYDFSNNPRLEKVRDLFIVGCWTGLRYSDLTQITPDKIQGDAIRLKQQKTGKGVVIPLHYTVKEILNKYDGILPKSISNQKYNEYLKEVAEITEIDEVFIKTQSHKGLKTEKRYKKYELISSHTARRSFCTNAYKDNIPTLSIMAISGHSTEKAFLKYIKVDAEEHAKKVLKIWQNDYKLKAVN